MYRISAWAADIIRKPENAKLTRYKNKGESEGKKETD
jgi:hypothetical protein